MRKLILMVFVLAAMTAGGALYLNRSAPAQIAYRTAPVQRGDLTVTIGATGTVEPEEVIDVGAQVLGKIKAFGTDANGKPVDYGTPVEEGMVLALIDESLYAADVQQATAQVEMARANVRRDQADLEQMKAKLVQAERNWKRAQELGPSRALAATDYDSYQALYETAKATLAVGEAAVVQSQKAVAQTEAALQRATTNLGYCTIRSPVDGVIIDRRVNIGQTVVASLNAPSLFLIAKDLRRMQVWVAVNEADIGQIHPGQTVRFTVDAFPSETFVGKVGKVRLNASMVQNVVNYTVEVNTDNSSGRLLPYLTANVQFEVVHRPEVLMVPNAALRWRPSSAELVAPDDRAAYLELSSQGGSRPGREGMAMRSGSRPSLRSAGTKPDGGVAATLPAQTGVVWVQQGPFVRPIRVTVGLSDTGTTEVESDQLEDGMEVIVGTIEKGNTDRARNPFTPQLFGGPRREGGG